MANQETSNGGWIKLHRKSLDSQVWQNAHLWKLWCYCLLKANYENKQWVPVDGITLPILVQRGQFVTGRDELHQAVYPKRDVDTPCPRTLWRYLKKLEKAQNLSIKSRNKYSVVTVLNYDLYQSTANDEKPLKTQTCPATVQQLSTNKKYKEIYLLGFDTFWATYPKKKAKAKALDVWEKLNPTEELTKTIIAAVERQKQSPQWRKDNGQYIPHPATWLNQRRWEDESLDIGSILGTHEASEEEIAALEKAGVFQ